MSPIAADIACHRRRRKPEKRSNDPGSATRRAGRDDCNCDAPAVPVAEALRRSAWLGGVVMAEVCWAALRYPTRNICTVTSVIFSEKPFESRLFIKTHKEMITNREECCITEHDQTPEEKSLAQQDEHHTDVLRVAHVPIQTGDDQSPRWIVRGGSTAATPNEINETPRDDGRSRDKKNKRKQAHVAQVEL